MHFLDVPSSYDIQLIIACLLFNTEKKSNFPKVVTRSDAYQIYSFHFTCSLIKIKNVEIYFMASGEEGKWKYRQIHKSGRKYWEVQTTCLNPVQNGFEWQDMIFQWIPALDGITVCLRLNFKCSGGKSWIRQVLRMNYFPMSRSGQ